MISYFKVMFKWIYSFYKTLFFINIIFSFLSSFTVSLYRIYFSEDNVALKFIIPKTPVSFGSLFLNLLPKIFIGGIIFSIGYFELLYKRQYYFYFNQSLTKVKLFTSVLIINTLIGMAFQFLIYYVQHF